VVAIVMLAHPVWLPEAVTAAMCRMRRIVLLESGFAPWAPMAAPERILALAERPVAA